MASRKGVMSSKRKQKLAAVRLMDEEKAEKKVIKRTQKEMNRQLPPKNAAPKKRVRVIAHALDSVGQALLRKFLLKPNIPLTQAAFECDIPYTSAFRRFEQPEFQAALKYQNDMLNKHALEILKEKRPALMIRAVELATNDPDSRVSAHMLKLLLQSVVSGEVDEEGNRQPDTVVLRFVGGDGDNNPQKEEQDESGESGASYSEIDRAEQ